MRLAAVFAVAAVACALTGCARGEPDIVVLKPVDSNGNVQRGWTAEPRSGSSSVDCSYGQPSRYDRAGGDTRECGATADSADACWPKQASSDVICLVDPFSKTLDIISASGLSAPVRAREHEPIPIGLVLDDGTQCRARNGGSWSGQSENPGYVGHYSCKGDGFYAIWAPPDGPAYTKTPRGWIVEIGNETGPLKKRMVVTALYIGIA